jgi:ketopantoate reductase
MSHDTPKRRVLVIGSGGVGTMVSVALERSGQACVTAVLRSNYEQVVQHGFEIESVDHGKLSSWKPSASMYPWDVPSQKTAS